MNILHNNIIRQIQICMRKIPDSLNSIIYQEIGNLYCFCLRNRKNPDLNIVFFHKILQFIHHTDLNSTDRQSGKPWVYVKQPF